VIRGFPKTTKSARISTTAISSVRYRRKGVGFCAMNAAGPPALQITSVPIFKGASHSCEPARRYCQPLGALTVRTSLNDKASVVASIKSAVSPQIPVASHTRIRSIAVSRCCWLVAYSEFPLLCDNERCIRNPISSEANDRIALRSASHAGSWPCAGPSAMADMRHNQGLVAGVVGRTTSDFIVSVKKWRNCD